MLEETEVTVCEQISLERVQSESQVDDLQEPFIEGDV